MKRKCAYTGKDSFCTDKPLHSTVAGSELHNWANAMPCSIEYKESKKDDIPNDTEIKIFEVFYLLEIARLKVRYLELKYNKTKENSILKEIELQIYQVNDLELRLQILQESNNSRKPAKKTGLGQKNRAKKKNEEIEAAIAVKNTIENDEKLIEKMLKSKKILF